MSATAFNKLPRAVWILLAFNAALLLARAIWINQVPDVEGDAYGHFSIGLVLSHHPGNLSAHWVWPPLYHYWLALLIRIGATFHLVRLLTASFACALSLAVYSLVASDRTLGQRQEIAFISALACALAPIVNIMSVTGQQEILFTLLLVLGAWGIERGRMMTAGVLVGAACLVRYEALGAVALLGLLPLSELRRRVRMRSWPLVAIPTIFIGAWIVAHRIHDGRWFGFLIDLQHFTAQQRAQNDGTTLRQRLWFPLELPWLLFGPTLLLIAIGFRAALRKSWLIPAGILLFLTLSYMGKGAQGLPRYYTALAPFACVAIAHGARMIVRRAPWPNVISGLAVASLFALTIINARWIQRQASDRIDILHDLERTHLH